jgi:hypothetical protein
MLIFTCLFSIFRFRILSPPWYVLYSAAESLKSIGLSIHATVLRLTSWCHDEEALSPHSTLNLLKMGCTERRTFKLDVYLEEYVEWFLCTLLPSDI